VATIRWPLITRRAHKWLAIFVAAQAVLWTLSGLYMTAVHIDIIHGDHFVRMSHSPPVAGIALIDPVEVARSIPGAEGLKLHWLRDKPTYIVSGGGRQQLVDAQTGMILPPPTEAQIRELANFWFTGDEPLAQLSLIQELPGEVRGRKPPLWRAEFGGWNKPTLYFSPATGELLTRRHELWRIFDFLWMLHIMDYGERENVNNWLLRTFTWAAVVMAVSGAWLLVYSFPRRKRRKG
jgi:uncharacterized iron-regulated membrane protein